jgi:hypothetical protein
MNTKSTPRFCNCALVEERNLIQRHIKDAATRKENYKGEEHKELLWEPVEGRFL